MATRSGSIDPGASFYLLRQHGLTPGENDHVLEHESGLAALGGLAAVAAVEYLGARNADGSGPTDLDSVGKPSGATLMALERIERDGDDLAGFVETGAVDAGSAPTDPPR